MIPGSLGAPMAFSVEQILDAYCRGVFPMADDSGEIHLYSADPRAIIPLDHFHTPRRLAKKIRSGVFDFRHDTVFRRVIEACAAPGPGRESTWISPEMIDLYCELQRLGFAHSVEVYCGEELVGGLYGVAIRGLFAGESMFSRQADASKAALVHLVNHLKRRGFVLLDTQYMVTDHLRQFGAIDIPREAYLQRLARAMYVPVRF